MRVWPGTALLILWVAGSLLVGGAAAEAQDNELGREVYDKWCGHCHGAQGDGNGVAASRLKPRPRDFTSGKYKIRMTTTGNIPTDEDIERAIRRGLPYSSMPAFPENFIDDAELDALVAYIKSFSDWFSDPEMQNPETIAIPTPPPYDEEAAQTTGRQIYEETGCARCHGDLGRGDGGSAPTLVDDWGDSIRVADLAQPWTFRGGGSRADIFRTMSTGFNGTPMPGFHNNLGATPEESRQRMWAIVDYMLSLSGGPRESDAVEAPYVNLLRCVPTEDVLDLERGKELFANAPASLFPIVGQIVEPGRNFYPQVTAIEVRAVHNEDEIAFLLTWHDMRAETSGSNTPDLQVPPWDEQLAETGGAAEADDEGGFWGDEEEGEEDSGDFWGEEEEEDSGGGDDFWGDAGGEEAAAGPTGPDTEFSDAVALQLPSQAPAGIRKPYFIFGDTQNPVDLWFVDLAKPDAGLTYTARGSSAMAPVEAGEPFEVTATYEAGEWAVLMKRQRKSRGSISFEENQFIPVAFSVWDGFNRERGNKRGLTSWYNVYIEPLERPSPYGPMARAGLTVLGFEILLIALMRRRHRKANGG